MDPDYHAIALSVLKGGCPFDGTLILAARHIRDGHFANDAALRLESDGVVLVIASVVAVKFCRFSQFGGALYQAITGLR